MKLQETTCLNCNSNDSRYYDEENGFKLVKCNRCGLLYVNPRPSDSEISEAMKTGLHQGAEDLNVNTKFDDSAITRYLGILSDFYSPKQLENKSWLDIGCGNGELLVSLQKFSNHKIEAIGSEPNVNKINTAKKLGLNVDFMDLENHNKQYDFLSMLNVFSHLPNPVNTIKHWRNLIKDSGELFLETGQSSHLSPKYHIKPYLLPDHLSFANKEIIVKILEQSGFEVIQVKIYRGIYDKKITVPNITKELIKSIIGKPNRFHTFFPKYLHGDMYIRAKKK